MGNNQTSPPERRSRAGRYLKYAFGEIILVVVGILIALWLNNLNQQRIESNERSNLKIALTEELLENKESFQRYKDYVEECHEKLILVLGVSTSENSLIPMDTLRAFVKEMIPLFALSINDSRLNSAKTSGQYSLLTSVESTAMADYETALNNYKEAKEFAANRNTDSDEFLLYFSTVELFHTQLFPDIVYPKHQDYNLSDEDFISFLKRKETYRLLNHVLTGIMLDISWLNTLDENIDETIETLNRANA